MNRITPQLLLSFFALAFLAPGQLVQEASGAGALDRAASEGAAYSASWRITGPTGGDVRALVVDPNDPDRFYFGTLDGQLYTSTDAGHNWRLLTNFNRSQLFVDHIIVDPRNSKVLYVATHRHKDAGGFFKSTDGGLTWRESPELRNEALHSMAQSESNPDVLLVGTITGIFRSIDAGETWSPLPTSTLAAAAAQQRGDKEVDVESLAIDPRNTNVIYAGTWYLPYKSTDGGQTWRIIKKGIIDDSDIFAINIDPRNANHIIASACSGIYDTRDAGENWSKVKGIPSQSRRTRAILQHPSVPGLVFAGTTEGFWRSANGGDNNSWMVTTSRQIEINSIAVHPRNPNTIYIGTNNYGVMVSTDGGKNFVPSNNGYSGRFVNSIVPDHETANRIYATTINTATGGGFFFVSSDGGATWSPSMRNMPPRLMGYSILQDESNGNVIYLGTNLGMYRSVDRGSSWAPMSGRKLPAPAPARKRPGRAGARRSVAQANTTAPAGRRGTSTTAAAVRPTVKLMAGEVVRRAQEALERAGYEIGVSDGQLGARTVAAIGRFQSDRYLPSTGQLDDATLAALGVKGNSTAAVAVRVPGISDPINAIVQFRDRSGHPGVLAATNNGLYRALDPAQGWDHISYGRGLDPRTTSISTSAQNPSVIFVGTATSGVLVSRDAGETWQQVSGVPATSPVNIIVQDQQRSAFIYVGTKQAFYLSHDGGDHWSRRGGNLPFGDFTSILINPRNGNEIFVGNAYQNDRNAELGGGVYRSADGGATWARLDSREHRLPSMRIWALALDTRDQNTLFVGSHSAGVYVVARGNEASRNSIP